MTGKLSVCAKYLDKPPSVMLCWEALSADMAKNERIVAHYADTISNEIFGTWHRTYYVIITYYVRL